MADPLSIIMGLTGLANIGANIYGANKASNTQTDINNQNIRHQRQQDQINWDRALYLMELQRKQALEDWNRNNAFNSPQQQMQRLKEAGLNPHLIYGNVNNSPASMVRGVDAKLPDTKPPRVEADGYFKALEYMQQIPSGIAQSVTSLMQSKQMQAQTNLINANTLKSLADVDLKTIDAKYRDEFNYMRNKLTEEMGINYENKNVLLVEEIKSLPEAKERLKKWHLDYNLSEQQLERMAELTKLASQQGVLNQFDIDYMQKLKAAGAGFDMIIKFLQLILK